MAYAPSRWAPGLLFVGVFWVIGTFGEIGGVEADLTSRSTAALGDATLDKQLVSTSGRDVTLSGAAFAPQGPKTAFDSVLALSGVRLVNGEGVGLLPEAKPYVWSATKDGAKIALAGAAPDPAARAAVNAAAKAIPGASVADGMVYKRGDTAALAAGAAFALAELAHFAKGSASLSDGALTLKGVAAGQPDYDQAEAALKAPPAGVTLAKAEIDLPDAVKAAKAAEAQRIADSQKAAEAAKAEEARKAAEAAEARRIADAQAA